jgi:hypothetical protein
MSGSVCGAQQYGLDCPGSKLYVLCGNLTSIRAGDEVQAAVAFLGPYSSKAAERTFEIRLTDLKSGKYADGSVRTEACGRKRADG